MVDPITLVPTVERTLGLEASSLRVEADGPCRLAARLAGGPLDPPRTGLRADVKAVTFYWFSVERHGHGWLARVVLDI